MGAHNELGGLYKNRGAAGQSPMPFGNYVLNKSHPLYQNLVACVASCNGMVEMVKNRPPIVETGSPSFNGDNWTLDRASAESIVFEIGDGDDRLTWQTGRGMTLFSLHGRPTKNAGAHETALAVYDNSYSSEKHVHLTSTGYDPEGRMSVHVGRRYDGRVYSAYAAAVYDVYNDSDRQATCGVIWSDPATTYTTIEIYQNAELTKSVTSTSVKTYQTMDIDRLRFGRAENTRGGYWDSTIELGLAFDRKLTAHEVQSLTNDPYGLIIPAWLAGLDFYRRTGEIPPAEGILIPYYYQTLLANGMN